MTISINQRKMLDRQQWEMVAPVGINLFDCAVESSTQWDQLQMWGYNTTTFLLYSPLYDSWMRIPDAGFTTFTGTSGSITYSPNGPTGTATAGSSTTLTTALTLPGGLKDYTIRLTSGTGAGQERTIAYNSIGTNSVITVTSAWTTTPDATSTFVILSGRFWVFNGTATVALRYFDVATSTWSAALAVPTALTTGVRIVATPSYGNVQATGTATGGTTTTLTNSAKAWTTNQFANSQVRILSGTGAGQVRTIASNTGTVLTVSVAFTTTPDATSVYNIEPNDDYLYATGGTAVTLVRYSISANTWTTLSPGTARTTPVAGATMNFIGTTTSTAWANESDIKNSRYLYAFNASSSLPLSYYDIAANTWVNYTAAQVNRYMNSVAGGVYAPVGNNWSVASDREFIYLSTAGSASATMPVYRYNAVTNTVEPFSTFVMSSAMGSIGGNRTLISVFTEGATKVRYFYFLPYMGTVLPGPYYRLQIIE